MFVIEALRILLLYFEGRRGRRAEEVPSACDAAKEQARRMNIKMTFES